MKSYFKTLLAGKNLGNLAFASSLVLHVGFIAFFSSWQWVFESPKTAQQKIVKIKLIPASTAQKDTPRATPQKHSHFSPARPKSIHSSSIPTLVIRSPKLSNPIIKSASRMKQTLASPTKRQFKPHKIQRQSLVTETIKPGTVRLTSATQQNHNSRQTVSVRPSPTLNAPSSEPAQPTNPATALGPGQTMAAQQRPQPSPTHISKVSTTAFTNALPMESTNKRPDKISPQVVPISRQTTISTETSLAAQQVAKHFASTRNLRFKSAALPRKLPQGSPAAYDDDNANLKTVRGQFTGRVRQRIADAQYYPRIARRRGMEGKPVIAFTLTKGGGLLKVNLAQTSGFQLLDQAALEAVHEAAPYPAIPAELKTDTYQFKLPISFVLK